MHVSMFVFVALLAHTLAEEPLGCKFSYDEALLEKMIRNEVKSEQLHAKVEATLDRVESTLKDIQKINKKMREEFIYLNETTFVQVGEFMKDSTDIIKNLRETLSTPTIGFKATGIKDASPIAGEVLVFPTLLFNSGDGYDASNGIFTAPVDGLYLFTIQLCMISEKQITASIMVEETEVGRSWTFAISGVNPCNTADAIAIVKTGQKVLVRIKIVTGSLITDVVHFISFSGALLRKGN